MAIGKPKIQEEIDGTIKIYSYDDWNVELKRRELETQEKEKGLVEVEEVKAEVDARLSLPDDHEVSDEEVESLSNKEEDKNVG